MLVSTAILYGDSYHPRKHDITMPVETAAPTDVPAALNFFAKEIQAGYEVAAVPSGISELLETISQVKSDIRLAKEKRNCIAKSWEANELTDMDKAIEAIELALAELEELIESVRVDMKLNHGQIGAWKKLMWVLRDSRSVLATSSRLMLAHSRLQNQMLMVSPLIGREASLGDERKYTGDTTSEPPPPPYDQATKLAIHERRQIWRPASTGHTTSTGLYHRRASSGVDAPDISPPDSAALPGPQYMSMPAQSASPSTSSNQSSHQSSRFNGTFQSMGKISPPNVSSLPITESSSTSSGPHFQPWFSPQSFAGTAIPERSRTSSKSVIDQDAAGGDTGDLLGDSVAYMQNDRLALAMGFPRRSTNPQILHSRFSNPSLNTNVASPQSSRFTPSRGKINSHTPISAMSPSMGSMGLNPGYQLGNQHYYRHNYPPANPADQNAGPGADLELMPAPH